MTNNIYKKISILTLIVVMAFILVACSSNVPTLLKYNVIFEILDDDTDEPIEGAEVKLDGQTKITDSTGVVSFEKYNGSYQYTVEKDQYIKVGPINLVVNNDNEIETVTMTEDLVDPTVVITNPDDGDELGSEEVTVEWFIFEEHSYTWELYLGGATFPQVEGDQDDPHSFTFDPASPDFFGGHQGVFRFRIEVTDVANNRGSDYIDVIIDARPNIVFGSSGEGYYIDWLDTEGNMLLIYVDNEGPGSAGNSITRVIFYRTSDTVIEDIDTPPIDPGENIELSVEFPPNVFNPDADFEVILDYDDDVDETNENDNEDIGIIIG